MVPFKKYTYGSHFAVFCCGWIAVDLSVDLFNDIFCMHQMFDMFRKIYELRLSYIESAVNRPPE